MQIQYDRLNEQIILLDAQRLIEQKRYENRQIRTLLLQVF